MTDNEIKKALEKMTYGGHSCMHCEYGTTKGDYRCGLQGCKIGRDALDLINRQQAKIERLGKEQYDLCSQIVNLKDDVKYSKTEAIKEFAERLRLAMGKFSVKEYWEVSRCISNLVKEMTEVQE